MSHLAHRELLNILPACYACEALQMHAAVCKARWSQGMGSRAVHQVAFLQPGQTLTLCGLCSLQQGEAKIVPSKNAKTQVRPESFLAEAVCAQVSWLV